jgi:hypothetical protein
VLANAIQNHIEESNPIEARCDDCTQGPRLQGMYVNHYICSGLEWEAT